MDVHDLVTQRVLNAAAFNSEPMAFPYVTIPEEPSSSSSMTTIKNEHEKSSPSTSAGKFDRPELSRRTTGKSTTSIPTVRDVDGLVQILSRRTTAGGQSTTSVDYEAELEGIMGGIFGSSENDISKRKKVGVIWKHLNVPFPPPTKR